MGRPKKQKIEIQCIICGKKKHVIPALMKTKYCSQDCYHKGNTIQTTLIDGHEFKNCSKLTCERSGVLIPIEEFTFRPKRGKRDSWCKRCRNDDRKKRNREPHGRYMSSVLAAKRRGIDWALTESDFIELAFQKCVYCGESTGEVGVGLDRKNSQLGYSKDNVVPCCCGCNRVRGEDYIPFQIMLEEVSPIIRKIKEARHKPSL